MIQVGMPNYSPLTKHGCHRIQVAVAVGLDFNMAKELELVITYSVNNDAKRKEAMIIKLVTKNGFCVGNVKNLFG